MAGPDLDNLSALLDDAKCFALVRQHRWPDGVCCPACASSAVIRDGCDDRQRSRRRYRCKACSGRFEDLTGTVLAGHHQPLRVWVLCLYFMGLNLSNRQIAAELGLNASDVQTMTEQLRGGLAAKAPAARLAGEVEIDEVYVVAGHKGQPAAVAKGGGAAAAAGWRERRAAARWRGRSHPLEAVPPTGLIQRGGQVVLRMLANVQQTTIQPIIEATVAKGTRIHTDEYGVYARLPAWGYRHETVCHARGEYARDEDGDGFCEIHVNTMQGTWSLLRSWLRPHRGISQEKLPLYLGFFEFVHNARRRGKAPLGALVAALVV
jgi:transposase-like protein